MTVPDPAMGQVKDLTSPYSRGEDWVSSKLTYKCKHCGNVWTKISERAVELPRSYVKTEYSDADRISEE